MKENRTAQPIEGESPPQYKKKMLCECRSSEAWIPNYGFLNIKENAQSVHLELQHDAALHVWTVTAWLAGKFQVSY